MDCRTCKHNTYIGIKDCAWFCCSHPVVISKAPKPAEGDPSFVSLMTTDFPISWIHNTENCPTYESAHPTLAEQGEGRAAS